jgi:hypothetical protein
VVQRSLQLFTASSRLGRIPAQQRAGRRRLWTDQAIEKMGFKRIAFDISCFFCKIGDFGANESFCNRAFIILGLGSGWPEKLVQTNGHTISKLVEGRDQNSSQENRNGNRERLETGNWKLETGKPNWKPATKGGMPTGRPLPSLDFRASSLEPKPNKPKASGMVAFN